MANGKLIIVMGTAASGKTHFIKEHFSDMDYKHISIGEYQRSLKTEEELDSMNTFEYFDYLAYCNEKAKEDMVEALKSGENVILEHTLYKAKRRIVYIEAAREVTDEPIDIYVMQPGRDRLRENLKSYAHGDESALERMLGEMSQIEYPNPIEGYDKIYSITDDEIRESVVSEDLVLVDRAKEELAQEAEKLKQREEQKGTLSECQRLKKELEYKPFWHICEVCGKKEYMTAEAAHIKGWDYPPKMGAFRVLSPRTCGDCGIEKTVWWSLMMNKDGKSDKAPELSSEHKAEVITRILREPYSLLEEE